MTMILISPSSDGWVDATYNLLRRRGRKVVRLPALTILRFLLMSERIAAVVVHEDCVPSDWEQFRGRMNSIAPNTRIIVIPHDDARSPDDVARAVADDG